MLESEISNVSFVYNTSEILNGTKIAKFPYTIPFLPLGLALTLLIIFGLIGNFLCVFVLLRPGMKSTYSTITLGLLLCDIVYITSKLFRYSLASFFIYAEVGRGYTDFFLPLVGPYLRAITFTSHTASTYFTMAVAVDRTIAVTWPLQAKNFWTKRRAIALSILVVAFSILFNASRWWEFKSVKLVDGEGAVIKYEMIQTDMRKNSEYKAYFIFWAYLIIMNIIPFVSLSLLNLAVWTAINRTRKQRRQLSSSEKKETSFAVMLIAVVIVFLICSLDYLVLDFLDYFNINYRIFWSNLGNFLLTINSAVNFFIYCTCGSKFRNEFIKMSVASIRKISMSKSNDNSNNSSERRPARAWSISGN